MKEMATQLEKMLGKKMAALKVCNMVLNSEDGGRVNKKSLPNKIKNK